MVKLTVDTDILWDGRLVRLAHALDSTQAEALGIMVTFWLRSRQDRCGAAVQDQLRQYLPAEYNNLTTIERLGDAGFIQKVDLPDMDVLGHGAWTWQIKDNVAWLEHMAKRSKAASAGGRARAAQMARPAKAKPKVKAKQAAIVGPTLNQRTWASYAQAYQHKYGAAPQDNARSRSLIAQLGQRLGEDAPDVASFFVSHHDRLYTRAMHALNLVVRDAEALRTQWATGLRMTDHQAKQTDEGQGIADQLQRLSRQTMDSNT